MPGGSASGIGAAVMAQSESGGPNPNPPRHESRRIGVDMFGLGGWTSDGGVDAGAAGARLGSGSSPRRAASQLGEGRIAARAQRR